MIREIITSVNGPKEFSDLLRVKLTRMTGTRVKEPLGSLAGHLDDETFCYAALNKVSRSFAMVIQQLPMELRDPVCIFYLVLRALDSIEDDTDVPHIEKLDMLRCFHEKHADSSWKILGVGDAPDYQALLANYDKVIRRFQALDTSYQEVILRICQEMGEGMARFAEKPVDTIRDYDLYCHYVAGLVGIGLSDLFAASGIESEVLAENKELSNSMGLFLQKTNIIRDYHEDLYAGRSFWPKEIWGRYGDQLEVFQSRPASLASMHCLNHYVANALQHAAYSLSYLSMLQNREVFRFCAIPQVMAMATLARLYNNPDVFTGVVKIRKGLTASIMLEISDFESALKYFRMFARQIYGNLEPSDASSGIISDLLEQVLEFDAQTTHDPALSMEGAW